MGVPNGTLERKIKKEKQKKHYRYHHKAQLILFNIKCHVKDTMGKDHILVHMTR